MTRTVSSLTKMARSTCSFTLAKPWTRKVSRRYCPIHISQWDYRVAAMLALQHMVNPDYVVSLVCQEVLWCEPGVCILGLLENWDCLPRIGGVGRRQRPTNRDFGSGINHQVELVSVVVIHFPLAVGLHAEVTLSPSGIRIPRMLTSSVAPGRDVGRIQRHLLSELVQCRRNCINYVAQA